MYLVAHPAVLATTFQLQPSVGSKFRGVSASIASVATLAVRVKAGIWNRPLAPRQGPGSHLPTDWLSICCPTPALSARHHGWSVNNVLWGVAAPGNDGGWLHFPTTHIKRRTIYAYQQRPLRRQGNIPARPRLTVRLVKVLPPTHGSNRRSATQVAHWFHYHLRECSPGPLWLLYRAAILIEELVAPRAL